MPAAIPLIGPALGIAGSILGSRAEKKAARQQVRGQEAAIETQKELLGPFAQAGTAGLPAVQEFVSGGADFSQTQAFKDIINTQKARGQGLSGNTLTSLTDFYATNFRPQRLNELLALPGLGANAAAGLASNVGGLQQNIGTAQARGTIGQGNQISSALGGLGAVNFSNLFRTSNLTSPLSASSQAPFSQPVNQLQPFGTFNTGIGPFGGG